MTVSVSERVRDRPLVATTGAVALGVLLVAVAAVVSVAGPGALPDPGGQRLGAAILTGIVGVGLLWLLVVARAVHGVVVYADADVRPTGFALVLAALEGVLATLMLVVASAAASLSDGTSDAEILAIGAYVVVTIGLLLAVVSLGRAAVALLGRA